MTTSILTSGCALATSDIWRPRIGDPTVIGWVTTAAYFVAAGLCGWAARRESRDRQKLGGRACPAFWWCLMGLLLALGINKQLDLHCLLTVVGRRVAREQGWYGQRRSVQIGFIAGAMMLGAVALAAAAYAVRRTWRRHGLALAGIAILCCFVVIRAASFHHLDVALGRPVLSRVRLHVLLELGGTAITALGAFLVLQWRTGSPVHKIGNCDPVERGAVLADGLPGRDLHDMS